MIEGRIADPKRLKRLVELLLPLIALIRRQSGGVGRGQLFWRINPQSQYVLLMLQLRLQDIILVSVVWRFEVGIGAFGQVQEQIQNIHKKSGARLPGLADHHGVVEIEIIQEALQEYAIVVAIGEVDGPRYIHVDALQALRLVLNLLASRYLAQGLPAR